MDAKLKAEWIAALRSGKYQQGTSYLRRGNHFCCLGVLCDVAKLGEWLEFGGTFAIDGSISVLDGRHAAVVGLDTEQQAVLMTLNDHDGKTFAQIADFIEKNVPAEHKTDISIFCEMLKTQAPLVDHQSAVDTCGNG